MEERRRSDSPELTAFINSGVYNLSSSGGSDAVFLDPIDFSLDPPASFVYGSRGCLGCCSKSTPITAVNEPSKGLKIQGRTVKNTNKSRKNNNPCEDLWSTTSTYEMDNNSAMQSQRSISSLSTSLIQNNQNNHNQAGSSNSNSNPNEFVNHGKFVKKTRTFSKSTLALFNWLLLWNQTRQQWLANKRPTDSKSQQVKEPKLSWSATYESLLGTNKQFPHPIPLSEMVDFLVDVWEQEGIYD